MGLVLCGCQPFPAGSLLPNEGILCKGSTKENENMPAKKDDLAKVRIHSHWDTLLLWLNGREWKVSNESPNKSNVLQHS